MTIPAGTATGTYFIGAIADDLDAVAEPDELNNALASSSLSILSDIDLVMTARPSFVESPGEPREASRAWSSSVPCRST